MAELAGKSSTKSLVWDYFGFEVKAQMGNLSIIAALFAEGIESKHW